MYCHAGLMQWRAADCSLDLTGWLAISICDKLTQPPPPNAQGPNRHAPFHLKHFFFTDWPSLSDVYKKKRKLTTDLPITYFHFNHSACMYSQQYTSGKYGTHICIYMITISNNIIVLWCTQGFTFLPERAVCYILFCTQAPYSHTIPRLYIHLFSIDFAIARPKIGQHY